MAFNPREASLPVQIMLGLALAVVIIVLGFYVPMSPVQTVKAELAKATQDSNALGNEVTGLQQFELRKGELVSGIAARQKQLDAVKEIVPDEKEVDGFIRIVQGAAAASNVSIRRLTAKPINPRDYHMEMPFEFEVDGPYYAVLDFFARLSRVSRIINVGDLSFSGIGGRTRGRFPVGTGTTVTGTFSATTFFTKGAEGPQAVKPGKGGPGQPGKQPAKR
jgi:type IV pilus assembly protein PilO